VLQLGEVGNLGTLPIGNPRSAQLQKGFNDGGKKILINPLPTENTNSIRALD